jgi:hypothetical protein
MRARRPCHKSVHLWVDLLTCLFRMDHHQCSLSIHLHHEFIPESPYAMVPRRRHRSKHLALPLVCLPSTGECNIISRLRIPRSKDMKQNWRTKNEFMKVFVEYTAGMEKERIEGTIGGNFYGHHGETSRQAQLTVPSHCLIHFKHVL